jgi:transposase-like protein
MARKKTSNLNEIQAVVAPRDRDDAAAATPAASTIASMAAEIARLRRERAVLTEEVEILRKADAFVAKQKPRG